MEEIKSLTYRVKETVAVAELGTAYAAILEAEARGNASNLSNTLSEEINNL